MSELLVSLINGMSKGEKRFFTLFHSHYEKEDAANTLQLFAAIGDLGSWDEEQLRKKHRGKSFLVYLAAEKQRLQRQLLETLAVYHRNGPVSFQVRNLLCQVELLFERKQFRAGEKLLQKALQLAEDACLFELKMDGLRLLNDKAISYLSPAMMEELYAERTLLVRKITENDAYAQLTVRLLQLGTDLRKLSSGQAALAEVENLAKHPLLAPDVVPLSALGQLGYHSFWSQYYFIRSDNANRRLHGDHIFGILVSRPLLVRSHFTQFIAAAANMLQDAYAAGDIPRLVLAGEQLEQQLKQQKKMAREMLLHIESLALLCRLYRQQLSGDLAAIAASEKETMQLVQRLAAQQSVRSFVIGFTLALSFLAQGNYRKVIRLLTTLETFPDTLRYEDRELKQRYLLLLCHFLLGNSDTVERELLSIRRHARRFGKPLASEEAMLRFFSQSVTGDGAKLKKKIAGLVESWEQHQDDPLEKVFQDFVYFIRIWMSTQLNGTSYADEWNRFIAESRGKELRLTA